jgi:hypothetical protein
VLLFFPKITLFHVFCVEFMGFPLAKKHGSFDTGNISVLFSLFSQNTASGMRRPGLAEKQAMMSLHQ